ncbi:hypothetical protein HYV81_02820 [Candidatus Woesearchaeota archaeon]|nr:hypothetical protein [Candidatus Woesearchaeota archaeon]
MLKEAYLKVLLIYLHLLILVIGFALAQNGFDVTPGSGIEGTTSGPGIPEDVINSPNWNWETSPVWEMNSEQILKFFDNIPTNRFDELDDDELEEALEKKYSLENVNIDLGSNTNNAEFESDSFFFDSAQYLGIGTTVINNGINVKFKQGNLTAEHADSVIKDGSISTNVDDLNAGALFFFLGQADYLMTNSITIRNIKNSTFKIDNQKVEIFASDSYIINITDKSFAHTPNYTLFVTL